MHALKKQETMAKMVNKEANLQADSTQLHVVRSNFSMYVEKLNCFFFAVTNTYFLFDGDIYRQK